MATLINDRALEAALIRRRREAGADRFDEVWNGVYFISPLANDEHQDVAGRLYGVLLEAVQLAGLGLVRPGVNVSDRRENWKKNYRCPDVAVFLNDTKAINCDTFWHGGPDFAVEVVSRGDRTRKKLPFYAKAGTRELLIVDRDPWALTLHQLRDGRLVEAARSTPDDPRSFSSDVVPLTFQFRGGADVPTIDVATRDGSQRWAITARRPA